MREREECSAWRREGTKGSSRGQGEEREKGKLFSVVDSDRGNVHNLKCSKYCLNIRRLFFVYYSQVGQTLTQVAQSDCEDGDI